MTRRILIALTALTFFAMSASAQDDDTNVTDDDTVAEEPSTADRALDELQRRYESLQQQFEELTTSDQLDAPVEWAQEDIENIGDWEYRVIEVGRLSAEELEATLNELGNERWQVIWIEGSITGRTIIMKRPAVSVISKLPLSALGRLLMRDSGGQ